MKICFLCNEYPPVRGGGIGVFTQVLGRALAGAGHEVRVLGVIPPDLPVSEYEEDRGVRVWRLRRRLTHLAWVAARYTLARTAALWARRGEIDLLEAPDYQGWTAGWPRLAVPVVARLHGSLSYFVIEAGQRPGWFIYRAERAALEGADSLCSVSRYTALRTSEIFRLRSRPIAVLHNPVEVPAEAPDPCGRSCDVVFSGTLAAKKGIQSLVRAWPLVAASCHGATLHIFGKDARAESGGSTREALERQLNGSGATVQFHGHVPRETVLAALDSARVAVFPSYAEAFALAPLEAMAHGCPTIYSRRGSGPELIRDGTDGLLVDPDDPRQIAAAIERVLTEPGLALRLGEAGRRRVCRDFSCDVLLRRNEQYYAACLEAFHSQ